MRYALFLTLLIVTTALAEPLPGTKELTAQGDLGVQMVEGINRFLLRATDESIAKRAALWHRDLSSAEKFEASVAPNRAHLAAILGVVDSRRPFDGFELVETTSEPSLLARTPTYHANLVRWPVIGEMQSEGILLTPTGADPVANVIALPDADQTPEMLAGLAPGIAPESQFARRLAESGCRVIIPALLDRSAEFSMPPSGQKTNQPHREYVYRPAFEMGRHVIGYEIQKVLAAVDGLTKMNGGKIAVMGYGEGGLIALDTAALDPRISAACVSGFFDSRQDLWQEPIYRNVQDLLKEFGDAEVATLVAPRPLVIEAALGPELSGPPAIKDRPQNAAPGRLVSPPLDRVQAEVKRAAELLGNNPALDHVQLVSSGADGRGAFGSAAALERFTAALGDSLGKSGDPPQLLRQPVDARARQKRMVDQMQAFTQSVVRGSDKVRDAFWSKVDRSSVEKWEQTTASYREIFATDHMGRVDQPLLAPNPRTRRIYDTPAFTGYEVMLDVFPDVYAYGILLVPKNVKAGERRPVVVCQHGLEGRPTDVADPSQDSHYYHRFACKLAEQGFVTYAPQNPYLGKDNFRTIVRKGNPLGLSLWSFIVPQHQQTTEWLASLPFVDPKRIAFYGLSYGGKTAMRVPALVTNYCLSICSGDFNEWIWKCTSIDFKAGYPGTQEYDMYEWNLGNTFNYSEMANLIAPRPFMVERGHRDGVGIDEWVSYEYAKVRRTYADLKIPERTTIEFFDGPHMINGVGTFKFLHEKLNWPEPAEAKP